MTDSAVVDHGGGALEIDGQVVGSSGGNALCDNVGPDRWRLDLDNATSSSVDAARNWWCATGSPADQIIGQAQFEPFLGRAPPRVRAEPR